MENENKLEDKILEASETKIDQEKVESKKDANCFMNKLCCKDGLCKCGKGKWVALAAVVLIIAVAGSYLYKIKKTDIGVDGAKAKVEQFIKENTPENGKGIEIKEVIKEAGLYKVTIDANKQEIVAYIAIDGSKFFPQAIDLNKKDEAAADKAAQAPEKTEAENKTDVPTVDLFVMSYCPYGLQMERGILPAVEALGNKIKFNLKFVDYALHGQKEVDENLNQYCISKTQPTKLNSYLKCFWKDSKGASAACMKTLGINAAQISTCVSDAVKQFGSTEKSLGVNKEEGVQFGVQGSPTLVVNETTIASGRDSASVLKAICSGFANQPKECQAKLSATSPVAGFDDQASASAGGSAPAASCETPAK